jgi:NifU-like protein involved in Fe-S cluster formation
MYSDELKKRFYKTTRAGELTSANGVGQEGNMKCGDIMKIFLEIDNKKIIKKARFLTYGCMAAIASTDMLCELVEGMSIDEALKITPQELSKKLGNMPSGKVHCSVLGTFALKNAINNYLENNN